MAKNPISAHKPTGQPFAHGERAGFELFWATPDKLAAGGFSLSTDAHPEQGEARHCFVRHIGKPFIDEFHARKARGDGRWIGPLQGWLFPAANSQKAADLTDQIGAFLATQSPSPESASGNAVVAPSRKTSKTIRFGQCVAHLHPDGLLASRDEVSIEMPFNSMLMTLSRELGGSFLRDKKHWSFRGPAAPLGRALVAGLLRGHLALRRAARAEAQALAANPLSLPSNLAGAGALGIFNDPAGAGVWIANARNRSHKVDFGLPLALFFNALDSALENDREEALAVAARADKNRLPRSIPLAVAAPRPDEQQPARWSDSAAFAHRPPASLAGDRLYAQARFDQERESFIARNPDAIAPPALKLDRLVLNHQLPILRAAIALAEALSDQLGSSARIGVALGAENLAKASEMAASAVGVGKNTAPFFGKKTAKRPQPTSRGYAEAGVLLFSLDRFWLSMGVDADDASGSSQALCFEASLELAKAWMSPGALVLPRDAETVMAASPGERLRMAMLCARVSLALLSDHDALAHCAARSGMPADAALAQVERLEILEEMENARREASPTKTGPAAVGDQRNFQPPQTPIPPPQIRGPQRL